MFAFYAVAVLYNIHMPYYYYTHCKRQTVSPPQKYTPGIFLLRTNYAKTGILWHGRGYRKSEIIDFVKTVN